MPKDVDLACDLAEKINSLYTGLIRSIQFTYDSYVDLDELPDEPLSMLTLQNMVRTRVTRGRFQIDATLQFTSISKVGPTDDPAWLDNELDSFDLACEKIGETAAGEQNCLPLIIASTDRYDSSKFHTYRRLVQSVLLEYRNL